MDPTADLKAFLAALKQEVASPSITNTVTLIAAGAKLAADIRSLWTPTSAERQAALSLAGTSLSDLSDLLEVEAAKAAIDWSKVLPIVIAIIQALASGLLKP